MAYTGRYLFAAALIGFGAEHFIFGEFVSGRAPAWPSNFPGQQAWAYISGAILAAAGISLAVNYRYARLMLLSAGLMVFIWALLRHLPIIAADLKWGGELTNAGKALTLWGGIFAVAGTTPKIFNNHSGNFFEALNATRTFFNLGRYCLGLFLIVCGIEHFIFISFVEQLVPDWIPGHRFWAYATGVALIAGGLGLMIGATLYLASILTGVMILLWFLMLHIPRAFNAPPEQVANEWIAVCESLAFSAVAFVLSGERQRR